MSAHTLIPDGFIVFNLVLLPVRKLNNCDLEGLGIWGTATDHRERFRQRLSPLFSMNSCSNLKKVRFKKKSQHWFNLSETGWQHFSCLDPFFQAQRLRIHILRFHFTIRYKQGLFLWCSWMFYYRVLSVNYFSENQFFRTKIWSSRVQ